MEEIRTGNKNLSKTAVKGSGSILSAGRTAPLVVPALLWTAGIITGFYLPFPLFDSHLLYLLIPAFLILIMMFVFLKERGVKLIILLLIIAFTGFLRSGISSVVPANHISILFGSKESITKEIEMRLTSEPDLREHQFGKFYRLQGDLLKIDNHQIRGKVSLTFPESYLEGDPDELAAGITVRTIAELTPYKLRRGFSRIAKPYFSNISTKSVSGRARSLVYIVDDQENHPDKAITSGFRKPLDQFPLILLYREQVFRIRRLVSERIESRFSDYDRSNLVLSANPGKSNHSSFNVVPFVKAILLGDREDMGDMRDLLARGGMAHLIAISGIHLAVITLIMMTFLKIFRIRRTPAGIILIIFFIIYGDLVNWTPSICRAAVMLSLLLICRMIQRKPSYNNIVAATIIIITAVDPLQIFSIGLQLSIISVLVLINIVPIFSPLLNNLLLKNGRSTHKLILYRISQLFLTSFFVSLFLMPLTLYYFNQFSINGIIGNLGGIMLLGIIMPLALAVILIPPVPLILIPFQGSLNILMTLFDLWSNFASSLPLFFNFIPFSFLQLLLSSLLLTVLSLWLKIAGRGMISFSSSDKKKKSAAISSSERRLLRLYSVLMTMLFVAILTTSFIQKHGRLLTVTMFHVGHGDLFLIETPDNERLLIDTGPPEDGGIHFRKAALPYLKQQGIKKLDWLIITHSHSDHYGGLPYIASNLGIDNLMITKDFFRKRIWKELQSHIDTTLTNLHLIEDTTHIKLRSMKCRILHPDSAFHSENPNDMSIVVKMTYHDFSILFTGDIEWESEMHLINNYHAYLESVFLKVPHHGSNTSSSPLFISAVNPDFAFIPTALRSRFNLPHPATLETLGFLEESLFISAVDGTIQIKTDGITINIRTFISDRIVSTIF